MQFWPIELVKLLKLNSKTEENIAEKLRCFEGSVSCATFLIDVLIDVYFLFISSSRS